MANCWRWPEVQRIFIGVPVDPGVQGQINALLGPAPGGKRNIRWVAERNRHLTLAFMGDQPPAVAGSLAGSLDDVCSQIGPFAAVFDRLTRFPEPSSNIIALVCAADARLARLYQLTQGLLARHGLAPEYESFRPHITLGRIGGGLAPGVSFEKPANLKLRIDRIVLYRSKLTRNGSVYHVLKESLLGQTRIHPG